MGQRCHCHRGSGPCTRMYPDSKAYPRPRRQGGAQHTLPPSQTKTPPQTLCWQAYTPPEGGQHFLPSVDCGRSLKCDNLVLAPMFITSERVVGAVMAVNKATIGPPWESHGDRLRSGAMCLFAGESGPHREGKLLRMGRAGPVCGCQPGVHPFTVPPHAIRLCLDHALTVVWGTRPGSPSRRASIWATLRFLKNRRPASTSRPCSSHALLSLCLSWSC